MRKRIENIVLLLLCFTIAQAQLPTQQLVTYTVQKLNRLEKGKPFNIEVVFDVKPEWYIYAPTGTNAAQGMIETRVVFTLPEGITRAGTIEIPEPLYKDGYEVLQGNNIVMRQPFKAAQHGDYAIKGKITWQSCSTDVCLPPVTEAFTTILHVQ